MQIGGRAGSARGVRTQLIVKPILRCAALLLLAVPVTAAAQSGAPDACPSPRVQSFRIDGAPGSRSPDDGTSARADTAARADTTSRADTPQAGPVDVAIIASASAREVRFARVPEVRVRLCGGIDSVRVVERRNLPERIVAGQVYRDIYIAVEILGRLDAACLARKLGVAIPADSSREAAGAEAAACAGVTIGSGATPGTGARGVPSPGMEDAPGRAQATRKQP